MVLDSIATSHQGTRTLAELREALRVELVCKKTRPWLVEALSDRIRVIAPRIELLEEISVIRLGVRMTVDQVRLFVGAATEFMRLNGDGTAKRVTLAQTEEWLKAVPAGDRVLVYSCGGCLLYLGKGDLR